MKIILRQPVEKLGQPGEIVSVKSGYARNFLIPQGFAYPAEGGYLKRYDQEKKKLAQINLRLIHDAEQLKTRLEEQILPFKVKVDEEDKLYGSVNPHEILVALAELGLELERKQLGLDHPLKELGEFSVPIKLHTDVTANVKVILEREGGEQVTEETSPTEEVIAVPVEPAIDEVPEADSVPEEVIAPETDAVEPEADVVETAPEDPDLEKPV